MNKKIYLLLIILLINPCHLSSQEKYVIGPRGRRVGFFSDFFAVLNHLEWSEKTNKDLVVHWDYRSAYYQSQGFNNATNAWEYYFYPVSKQSYKRGDTIHRTYVAPGSCLLCIFSKEEFFCPSKERRLKVKRIIDSHIKLKPMVQKKVDDFLNKNMHGTAVSNIKTIGIHWRGGPDKANETRPVSAQTILDEANSYANGQPCQFFVASDTLSFIEKAKKQLKGNVIHYDCFRAQDNLYLLDDRRRSSAQSGEDVLIEALLLSQCDALIHTRSNVSAGVLCFNPNLEHIVLGAPHRSIKTNVLAVWENIDPEAISSLCPTHKNAVLLDQ